MSSYLEKIGVSENFVLSNSKEAVTKEIKLWDKNRWNMENERKSTLKIYCKFRKEIQQQRYQNNDASLFMLKARTNTMLAVLLK